MKIRVNNFDLIRLLAALQVAVKHCMVHFEVGTKYIDLLSIFPGVPIFFFISGFLIFTSYKRSKLLYNFAVKRVLRIFPALIICCFLSIGLAAGTGFLTSEIIFTQKFFIWVLAQLSIVQFYNPDFLRQYGVGVMNGSLWTISVELQFYIFTPILAFLVQKRKWVWAALLVTGVAANLAMPFIPGEFFAKLYSVSSIPWVYMFIGGALFTELPKLQEKILKTNLWLLLFLYLFSCFFTVHFSLGILGNDIGPVNYLLLVLLIFKLAFSQPGLSEKILRKNDISYGIYIFHMPILNWVMYKHEYSNQASVAIVLLLTICVAILSWFLIEKPALSLKENL